jgi:hypothetical protein
MKLHSLIAGILLLFSINAYAEDNYWFQISNHSQAPTNELLLGPDINQRYVSFDWNSNIGTIQVGEQEIYAGKNIYIETFPASKTHKNGMIILSHAFYQFYQFFHPDTSYRYLLCWESEEFGPSGVIFHMNLVDKSAGCPSQKLSQTFIMPK